MMSKKPVKKTPEAVGDNKKKDLKRRKTLMKDQLKRQMKSVINNTSYQIEKEKDINNKLSRPTKPMTTSFREE